ncbi:pre-rRNA-processing protein esf1 [Gossypium australe]|uniref:Pre-rRNA-processing protein esf1 n=1 Tax=Gossypium australe TaxID=47621 RepID=A0A5B6V5N5_9ROSI|nr:pre-rRNA-processing protein esf1 [Gossypium australe]
MGSKTEGHKAKTKTKNKPDSVHSNNNKESGGGKIIKDARFASLHSDPRFQKVPKRNTKVVIDSRFNRMFTDKRFASSSAPLDKRGKPKKGNTQSSLRHYYHLEEEEGEEEKRKKAALSEEDGTEEESDTSEMPQIDSDGELEEEEISESGSTTEEEDIDIDYEDGEPEIQAVDLYVMLSSFLPKDGQIISVAVYPSEFGLQRMKEEEIHGPVGLFDGENEDNDEDGDDEIDNEKLREYERSRLRYYYAVVECDSSATADYLYKSCDGAEFERSSNVLDLRFIPDSMEFKHEPRDVAVEAPANYEGLNFQTQALQQSKINLSWDEDEPQRGKILKRKLNDEQLADLELKEFLASDESESDDDDDENEDTTKDQPDKKNKKRDLYRALLQSGDGSDGDGEEGGQDMEVTFNTGLEDISKRILEKKDKQAETVWEAYLRKRREKKKAKKNKSKYSSEDETDDTDIEEATEEADDFFVEEPSLKKSKKERKKHEDTEKEAEASRAELELLLTDDKGADTGLKGYNLKAKKAKGKKQKEVLDVEKIPVVEDDPRFSALFTSPLFALDPTDPRYKRSATYARQIAKKLQKGEQQELAAEDTKISTDGQLSTDDPGMHKAENENSDVLPSKEKHNLSSMVRSVKMKLKQVQLPSKRKVSKKSVSGMGRKKEKHRVHSNNKAKDLNE